MRRLLGLVFVLSVAAFPAAAEVAGKRPHIVDGETLVLLGQRVRLFGVDAPALDQVCETGGEAWHCGQVARWRLVERIGTNWVVCVEQSVDPDGTIAAQCYLGGRGGYDLNAWAVAKGWALARRSESPAFAEAEDQARTQRLGLWR